MVHDAHDRATAALAAQVVVNDEKQQSSDGAIAPIVDA